MTKDYSVSLVRLIALIFVVVCHIMQYFDFFLCLWFNVGVQMFLCISGYLFGNRKNTVDVGGFIGKRFTRILVDYYLLIIPVLALYFIFKTEYVSMKLAALVLILYDTLDGGGHLWYIPYILLCYCLTPIYWNINGKIIGKKNEAVYILLIFVMQIILFETYFSYFNSAWINCFYIGILLGELEKRNLQIKKRKAENLILVAAVLSNAIQIYIDYVADISFVGFILGCYHRYCNYAHVLLGVALFVIIRRMCKEGRCGFNKFSKGILDLSDKYSYDIYLTHQFMILGPFTLMNLTDNLLINIIIIVAVFILLSFLLNKISSKLIVLINRNLVKNL